MKHLLLTGLAALLLAAPLTAQNAAKITFSVGDKAPPMTAVNWLKGEPVSEWKRGHVYVLDFWATWCGPCISSIPHLNELANRYRDQGVTLIGAAVAPRSGMRPTDKFVADMGDEMNYPIAEDIDGATSDTFMHANGRNTLPTTMIIDKQGVLAWVGNPVEGLEGVLAAVVEDRFDDEFKAELAARNEELNQMMAVLNTAYRAKEWDKVAAQVALMIEADTMRFKHLGRLRYDAHLMAGEPEAASAWGRELVGSLLADDSNGLNSLAWSIVDPRTDGEAEQRDLELARLAGDRANVLTKNKNPAILDTVARVAYLAGDLPTAIQLQQRAIDHSGEGKSRDSLGVTLQTYVDAFEAGEG